MSLEPERRTCCLAFFRYCVAGLVFLVFPLVVGLTVFVVGFMQHHFGILLDAERDFPGPTDFLGSPKENTPKAILMVQALVLTRLLGLLIQLEATPLLTPAAWLWFQSSDVSGVFFGVLRSAVNTLLQGGGPGGVVPGTLVAAVIAAIWARVGPKPVLVALDEAQAVAIAEYRLFSPPRVRICCSPVIIALILVIKCVGVLHFLVRVPGCGSRGFLPPHHPERCRLRLLLPVAEACGERDRAVPLPCQHTLVQPVQR